MKAALAWIAVLRMTAVAAEPPAAAAPVDVERQIRAAEGERETRIVGVGRVRLSVPQKFSAALGALVVHQPANYDCTTVCDFRGLLLQAEPGLGGGQLAAGYAVVLGEERPGQHFLSDVYMAYGIKVAVLRTWGDADLDPPHQTLAGLEGDFTIARVNFSLGLFRSVAGAEPRDPWVLSGGIGWGF